MRKLSECNLMAFIIYFSLKSARYVFAVRAVGVGLNISYEICFYTEFSSCLFTGKSVTAGDLHMLCPNKLCGAIVQEILSVKGSRVQLT